MKTSNRVRWAVWLCAGVLLMSGCKASEKQQIYEQAGRDLEQGSYAYALNGFQTSIQNQVHPEMSYRGAGICSLRMGNYEDAVTYLTNALACENVSKALQKDLLSYRATAFLRRGQLVEAMADCSTLAAVSELSADGYFLTGQVALAMDSYTEAFSNFEQSLETDDSYERAIQIYEVYVDKDMEADGTWFLEQSLTKEAKSAQDFCDRGRIYYYMDDYEHARDELIEAQKRDSTESFLLLGMVYMAMEDYSNARAMYTQFIAEEGDSAKGYNGLALCDMAQKNYSSALTHIQDGIPCATTEELQSLLFNEIVIYERQLDFATARLKAQEYVEMFPEDEQAARELTFLRTRTGG